MTRTFPALGLVALLSCALVAADGPAPQTPDSRTIYVTVTDNAGAPIEDLSADERQGVEAASVIGVEFSLWLTAQGADVDELALEPVLEVLARRQTFIARNGVIELANGLFSPLYRFKHSLYQEIVLDGMGAAQRAHAHGRVGLALERLFAGREREIAAELAYHFHGAGDHSRAARYLRLAAENALRRYAPREAAALLHGAVAHASHLPAEARTDLELPLMLELGQAQLAAGEAELAVLTLNRLDRRAESEQRPNDRLRAVLALADAHIGTSREPTLRYARLASQLATSATDATLAATAVIRSSLIELYFEGWADSVADRALDAWRTLPKPAADEQRTLAIRLLTVHQLRAGYSGAWTAGRRLLPMALRSGNLTDCLYCYQSLVLAALHLGRWGDAMEVASEGAMLADRTGASGTEPPCGYSNPGSRSKGSVGTKPGTSACRSAGCWRAAAGRTRCRCRCCLEAQPLSGRAITTRRPPIWSACVSGTRANGW